MCGIAGIVDLSGQRPIADSTLRRMAHAIEHRGPDEFGIFRDEAVGLVSRRLSIVDLADGQQPVFSEDNGIVAVFNGEIFNHQQLRANLERQGHHFRSRCDSEVLVHLWEQHGEGMLERLRGQFAFAVYDTRRRIVMLARDRVGICPLHWTQIGNVVLFASEIKSLLASGMVNAELDLIGLDQVFTFFGMPTRRTMFQGVASLPPGGMATLRLDHGSISERSYWDFDFPDAGAERDTVDEQPLVDEFDSLLHDAVETRTQADVPVVAYLSGGVDSATICALAQRRGDRSLPSFTIKICDRKFDEEDVSRDIASQLGMQQTVVRADALSLQRAYAGVVLAAESPVVDTACAALYLLAAEVRRQGYKVALTGEGADEALAGYPWFKVNRLLNGFSRGGMGDLARRIAYRAAAPDMKWSDHLSMRQLLGGSVAQADFYSAVASARRRFFRPELLAELDGQTALDHLDLDYAAMRRWHPLNQSIYVGYKTILPGLLLHHKGDRVAMAHSVETRYPFLDERVIKFCSQLAPRWKLRGLLRDKVILRRVARRMLPAAVADRPKAMFRAPFGATFFDQPSPWVEQLLSTESLEQTGYFDIAKVRQTRKLLQGVVPWPGRRVFWEMGLTAVLATQLWSHLFLGGGLCELATWTPPAARDEDGLLFATHGGDVDAFDHHRGSAVRGGAVRPGTKLS